MRKTAFIIGLLMLAAGGAIATGMVEFSQKKDLLSIGSTAISYTEKTKPDLMIGYILLGLGGLSVLIAAFGKK